MDALLHALNTDADHADNWIRIVGADWFEDELRLDVAIRFGEGRAPQFWEIECAGVVEDSLNSAGAPRLGVSVDHPALAPFVEPTVDIMFAHNAMRPESLLGIVCACCAEVMGGPDALSRFLNGAADLAGICRSEYGLLGRFPASLAQRIRDALAGHPIALSLLNERAPQRWSHGQYVAYPPLQLLGIGSAYVIAERFEARRA